jgi:hypothetical protein
MHPDELPTAVEVVVALIIDLFQPHSVVDFGCNVGVWLDAFRRRGIVDILGIDKGHAWTQRSMIPTENFFEFDLENVAQIRLNRTFDVALCLETAEHLEPAAAPYLVQALCKCSRQIIFSAALPGQTGCGHKNEQFPDYWMQLFRHRGFEMYDCFRQRLWTNPQVEFWYKQNMYLFSRPDELTISAPKWDGSVFIAPELLELYVNARNYEISNAAQVSSRPIMMLNKRIKQLSRRIAGHLFR